MAVDPLAVALHDMAGVFGDGMTADMLGCKFTCREAETVADVLTYSGHGDAAEVWLRGHAEGDDGGDLHGVCRHCDTLLYLDEEHETVMDTRGSAWCSPERETEHEPTSWISAGRVGQ